MQKHTPRPSTCTHIAALNEHAKRTNHHPPTTPTTNHPAKASRWFEDALADAQAGDVKACALVSAMYSQGYGTTADAAAAARWADKARARGYRMSGVYCAL